MTKRHMVSVPVPDDLSKLYYKRYDSNEFVNKYETWLKNNIPQTGRLTRWKRCRFKSGHRSMVISFRDYEDAVFFRMTWLM